MTAFKIKASPTPVCMIDHCRMRKVRRGTPWILFSKCDEMGGAVALGAMRWKLGAMECDELE
jgi:hypothetical protein